jgi:hypothetical protein
MADEITVKLSQVQLESNELDNQGNSSQDIGLVFI